MTTGIDGVDQNSEAIGAEGSMTDRNSWLRKRDASIILLHSLCTGL
jgi:hypothetical protein